MFNFKENKYPILKNETLQKELDENGFVVIPFYNEADIKKLEEFYFENSSFVKSSGFQPTTYFNSLNYRIKSSNYIKAIARPYLEKHLQNYKTFMGSYIVKHSDKNSELNVHQDMTLVDESLFMGINIWAPLCNTTDQNGALYIIPKSNRLIPTYRNATIKNIYDKHFSLIKQYMKPIYIKAGEAILFDNSLLHYSPINRSNKIRIATNVFITHMEAKITICYHDKEKNKIELFEQADDFFTNYKQFGNNSNQLRPKIGKSIGFVDYDFPDLTPKILSMNYGKIPFWKRLKSKILNK